MFSNNSEFLIKLVKGVLNIITTTKKIIPIYNDIKPLLSKIQNTRNYLSNIKINFSQSNKIPNKKEEVLTTNYSSSNLKFFI